MTALQTTAVALARTYVGIREAHPNSGPEIDKWLAHVRCNPGDSYCAAFVSYVIDSAYGGIVGPPLLFRKSASALRLRDRNPELEVDPVEAKFLLRTGEPLIFIIPHGAGHGHAGFAIGLHERLLTIEANTMDAPSSRAKDRDGQGVYERDDRHFGDVSGFLRIA